MLVGAHHRILIYRHYKLHLRFEIYGLSPKNSLKFFENVFGISVGNVLKISLAGFVDICLLRSVRIAGHAACNLM